MIYHLTEEQSTEYFNNLEAVLDYHKKIHTDACNILNSWYTFYKLNFNNLPWYMKFADVKNISTKIEYLHKRRIELAYEISTKAYNLVKGLYAEYEKNFKYSILNTLQFKPQSFDSFEKDLFGGGGFYSTKKKIVLDVVN